MIWNDLWYMNSRNKHEKKNIHINISSNYREWSPNATVMMSRNLFRCLERPLILSWSILVKPISDHSLEIKSSELDIKDRELVIRIRPIGYNFSSLCLEWSNPTRKKRFCWSIKKFSQIQITDLKIILLNHQNKFIEHLNVQTILQK